MRRRAARQFEFGLPIPPRMAYYFLWKRFAGGGYRHRQPWVHQARTISISVPCLDPLPGCLSRFVPFADQFIVASNQVFDTSTGAEEYFRRTLDSKSAFQVPRQHALRRQRTRHWRGTGNSGRVGFWFGHFVCRLRFGAVQAAGPSVLSFGKEMNNANSNGIFSRALMGGVVIGILTFLVGIVVSYAEAYLIGPPNWKFGRHGEFELGVYATFWISVFMVICYGISCPIYIRISEKPKPILFALFTAASFGILGATDQLRLLTSPINFDFGPNSNGLPEIFASAFAGVFLTALLAVFLFWIIETAVQRVSSHRRTAR